MSTFRTVTFIDTVAERDLIPHEVMKAIEAIWDAYEFGNDHCIIWGNRDEDSRYIAEGLTPNVISGWLTSIGLDPSNVIICHWW